MKVKVFKADGVEIKEIQELYLSAERTEYGKITFALVNLNIGNRGWNIVEYTTGLCVFPNIGKISLSRFARLTGFIIKLNPQKLIERINENEKIN